MVYILIPAHNNKKEVLEVLECLNHQTYSDIKIVLVDDGSTDNTEEEIRLHFPDVIVLKGDGNLWWTGANVMGIDYIIRQVRDGDFVLLLNNDLTVGPDYVEALVKASISHRRAIVGSTLVDYSDPNFLESGIKFDNHMNLTVNRDKEKIESTEFDMDIDVLPGRGTLIPIEVFKKIGNFNAKKLPHYGADYEFTIRAKRAGYKLIASHKARVLGNHAYSTGGLKVPDKKTISLRECFNLLFSTKSTTNVYYYLNYIWLCSDENFRVKNVTNSAIGILRNTLFRTIYFFFIYAILSKVYLLVKRLVLFIFKFLFKDYPFRKSDIERYGINPKELIEAGILEEYRFREKKYYLLTSGIELWTKTLPSDKKNKIIDLKRLSYSYSHKIAILKEKIKTEILKKPIE